jgi:hypothetical protein
MKVYHGSDIKIKTIDLTKCRVGTDFGHGFYVTKYIRQAEDVAARVASWHDTSPVITEFEFNEYAFEDKDFKVLRFDSYTDQWLDFIVKNRASITSKPMHNYDIVKGPVANDDIAARIERKRPSQIFYAGFVIHFGKNKKNGKEPALKYDEGI